MENASKTTLDSTKEETKISTWFNHSFPLIVQNNNISNMTLKITKTIPINDKLTIMYVKQASGSRTRSVQFNLSKTALKVVPSDFDKDPTSRVRLSAAFENDNDGVSFNNFCTDLSKKIEEVKQLLKDNDFDVSDFKDPIKTLNDDLFIYVKVKSAELKNKLKEVPDHVECRASIRINCLWRSELGCGISLDLASFTPL